MRRLKNEEDGATAVVVALSLVVLFGFGALAVDVGQIYQERRELQNGADAAALAAAHDCAEDPISCSITGLELNDTVDEYANANANDDESSAEIVELSVNDSRITVETETLSGGNNFLTHWLAGLIGHPTTTVTAQATAAWGAAGGGTTIPLTFSYCEWDAMVDLDSDGVPKIDALPSATKTIYFHDPKATDCSGPAGQDAPGGFGWLDPDGSDQCQSQVDAQQEVGGETGNGVPHSYDPGCDVDHLESLIDETILIPIFSQVTNPGTNATYFIEGFAAFVLEGYSFGGQYKYPNPPPCSSSETCIEGHFTDYIAHGDYVGGGVGSYGVSVVTLTR